MAEITDKDRAAALRAAGITAPDLLRRDTPEAGVPADDDAPALDKDTIRALEAAGIDVGTVHGPRKAERPRDAPEPDLPPAMRAEANRVKKKLTPLSSVTEGMPVIGAAPRLATAGISAAVPGMGMEGDSFGERFGKNEKVLRTAQQEYDAENPQWSIPGNLVGGAMAGGVISKLPYGAAALGARGPSLGARTYAGGAGSAIIGGVDAAIRGDSPVHGAIVGGAGGAAAPWIGEGFRGVTNVVSNRMWPRPGPLQDVSPINIERLTGAISAETPASLAAARGRIGPTGFLSDINPEMTDVARGLSWGNGEPKAKVREPYRLRDEAQGVEMKKALDTHIGQPVDDVAWNKMTEEGRKKAVDPLYTQWRASTVPLTPELESLVPRLQKAGAFKRAEELSGISGEPINTLSFTTAGAKPGPTAKSWQYVKQGLNREIDAAYNSGDKTLARELVKLKRDFTTELHAAPGGKILKQADETFSSHSNLIDQYAAGRDTLLGGRSGITKSELKEEFGSLTGPEKKARIQGMRNAIEDAMGEPGSADDKMLNKLLGPNNQDKIKLMIGDKPGEALVERMKQLKHLQTKNYEIQKGPATKSNFSAVEALQPPVKEPWELDITKPMSVVPPSVRKELRPSSVVDAWRGQRYGNADSQLADLVTKHGVDLDLLLNAIQSEAVRRGKVARGGEAMAGGAARAISAESAGRSGRRATKPD